MPCHTMPYLLHRHSSSLCCCCYCWLVGIKYVVDAGFVKTRFITSQTGTEMLKVRTLSDVMM